MAINHVFPTILNRKHLD